MNKDLNNLISEIEKISDEAQKTFGHLNAERINWKPAPESWSVGQCFEHLIKTNRMFFPELEKIKSGERKNSFWENYSPFTSFFGRMLTKSMRKDERKYKTSAAATPPSDVQSDIIEQFSNHQTELVEMIRELENADWKKTVVTSPFLKIATYNLTDGFNIVIEHERRHFRQAERVLQAEGFPKSEN
ncbi:MAG TPA: DinB family protein [Pyrinomonadaceae bacterium]|nr:DinB family protein [Pyrinomonadaceae bacterium]